MSVGTSVIATLGIAIALASVHLVAPRLRALPGVPERSITSFAGGIAVSYVFLHLFPEFVEGNEAVGEALDDVVQPTPLLDLAIFAVALTGFVLLYGLERRARGAGAGRAEDRADGPALFWVHLGTYVVYNALITYTMPLRLRTGVAFAILFTVAMGLHFVLTDRGLASHYPRRFGRSGRPVLAGSLVLGWVAVALFAPTSTVLVALLTAFLGGSILLNVLKDELPAGGESSFGWFCTGVVLYAALLAGVTALSE